MKNLQVDKEIRLAPLCMEHALSIFQTIDSQREYLGEWLPFVEYTKTPKDTEEYIKSVVEVPTEKKEHVYSIFYKEDFAGLIGTKETDQMNKHTEFGYWLSKPFQHKGIISRSLQFLIHRAFNEWMLHRVVIKVAVGNKPSNRIPKRFGFLLEGIEREGAIMPDGSFLDLNVYSKIRTD